MSPSRRAVPVAKARRLMAWLVVAATLLVVAACADEGPTVTVEDELESIAGGDLTPAEIQRQLDVASTLCQIDGAVLESMWATMSAQQLRFQDYVFGTHCPERSIEFARATGRSLTPEAHQAILDDAAEAERPSTLPLPSSSISSPASTSSSPTDQTATTAVETTDSSTTSTTASTTSQVTNRSTTSDR